MLTMLRSRLGIRRLLLAGVLLALTLCAAARADENPVIRIGMTPVETLAGVYYAEDMGFFRKAGITVEVTQSFAGGAAVTAAVVSGNLDIGAANPLSFANAVARGVPIRALASASLYSVSQPQSLLVIAPNRPVPTASQLNGKVFCGVSVAGMDQLAVVAWMDKMGGDAASVKFVELRPTEEADALQQGRVDACVLAEPVLSEDIAESRVKPISKIYGIAYGDRFSMALFFASVHWLNNNGVVARKFAAALSEASLWASAHPEQAAVILNKYTNLHVPRAQMIVARSLDVGIIQPVLDVAAKYKMIPRTMKAEELIWK